MRETYFHIRYLFGRENVWTAVEALLQHDRCGYVVVADGVVLTRVQRDLSFRKVVHDSLFAICDSSWVPLYIKAIYGRKREQYCGFDLMMDGLQQYQKYRMMFLGSDALTLAGIQRQLDDDGIDKAGMTFLELPFKSVDDFDYPAIAQQIEEARVDLIWVALGAPKQCMFMQRLKPHLKRGVMFGVGAAFKFYSGVAEKRAPKWMVLSHMEFLFRLTQDPKKQFDRCSGIVTTLPQTIRSEMSTKRTNEQLATQHFFSLLRVALGTSTQPIQAMTAEEWLAVYEMSRKQSISGLLFMGLNKHYDSTEIQRLGLKRYLRLKWLSTVMTLERVYRKNLSDCKELDEFFRREGIPYCIFKGQALHRYYGDDAKARHYGDIDVWTPTISVPEFADLLNTRGISHKVKYAHAVFAHGQGTITEVHHTPAFFRHPGRNRRLQEWLKDQFAHCERNEEGLMVPSVEFDLVYLLIHIYHHFMFEGIGIRQFVDYFYLLRHLHLQAQTSDAERQRIEAIRTKAMTTFKHLGIQRFVAGSMHIIHETLGLEAQALLCPPDAEASKTILHEIICGGNFGKFDKRYPRNTSNLLARGFQSLRRRVTLMRFGVGETLVSPFWSIWQIVWRRGHEH